MLSFLLVKEWSFGNGKISGHSSSLQSNDGEQGGMALPSPGMFVSCVSSKALHTVRCCPLMVFLLCIPSRKGALDMVVYLVSVNRSDPTVGNKDGWNSLHVACL